MHISVLEAETTLLGLRHMSRSLNTSNRQVDFFLDISTVWGH